MAVTLALYAPFDSGNGADVTESNWRDFMQYMLDSGPIARVLNELEMYADSSGMQVKVKTGEVWIKGHWGRNSSEQTLPIASNSSGSTRLDRGVVRCNFNTDLIELDVLTGTTSAPPLTQNTSLWEISLGQISVANGAVTIAAANVTDERSPVGIVRNHPRASLRQTVSQSLPDNAFTSLTFTAEDVDSHYGHSTTSNTSRWVAPVPGVYEFSGGTSFAVNSTGSRGCRWAKNGVELNASQILHPNNGALLTTIIGARTIQVPLLAGDYVELQGYHNSGGLLGTAVNTSEQPNFTVRYISAR